VLMLRRALANRFALLGVGAAVALQMLTTIDPLARILDVAPLSASEWLSVGFWGALPAVVGQISKMMRPAIDPGASGRG